MYGLCARAMDNGLECACGITMWRRERYRTARLLVFVRDGKAGVYRQKRVVFKYALEKGDGEHEI